MITCSGCDQTWTAPGAAHCGSCHRLFAAPGLFDKHRSQYGERGACVDPTTLTGRSEMVFRDGMWRGPEMTDEQQARLRSQG